MKTIQLDFTKEENLIDITEDSEIWGRFVGKGDDKSKSQLVITHTKPNLKSRVNIKAIVFDKSKFDFEGLIRIEKGATGSDTYLKIDCLIIDDTASARAIPSLEILESEVKAGHGATIGYLDPEQMNYLQSHGVTEKEAEKILIEAFL